LYVTPKVPASLDDAARFNAGAGEGVEAFLLVPEMTLAEYLRFENFSSGGEGVGERTLAGFEGRAYTAPFWICNSHFVFVALRQVSIVCKGKLHIYPSSNSNFQKCPHHKLNLSVFFILLNGLIMKLNILRVPHRTHHFLFRDVKIIKFEQKLE
jgi:hypothetical protein